jgi:hypothetical protein
MHIHKNISSVNAGGSSITREEHGIAELETDRTWAFDAPPIVEERILEDVELSGRTAGAVPTTYDEKLEELAAEKRSAKDVGMMASGLRELLEERRSA